MLTRVYIDNFRCFENFEYRPGQIELLMGENGSGKSSFMDALLFLRDLSSSQITSTLKKQRPRWSTRNEVTFELDAVVEGVPYSYRVVIDSATDEIAYEELSRHGVLRFRGERGVVSVDGPEGRRKATLTPNRSAVLQTLGDRRFEDFRLWLGALQAFRLNPFAITAEFDRDERLLSRDGSNLANWYRHYVHHSASASKLKNLRSSLAQVISGFNDLRFADRKTEKQDFMVQIGSSEFALDELSEGQKCLVVLYAVLHLVIARGRTVIVDEPENFLALREIQPWLMSAIETAEHSGGQLLLISHHPELIDQLAPGQGVRFVREGKGVRTMPFSYSGAEALTASELIARGWDDA